MGDLSSIRLIFCGRDPERDGTGSIRVRGLSSSLSPLSGNELLRIVNTMRRTSYMDPGAHEGFTYTFDRGDGSIVLGEAPNDSFTYVFEEDGFGLEDVESFAFPYDFTLILS